MVFNPSPSVPITTYVTAHMSSVVCLVLSSVCLSVTLSPRVIACRPDTLPSLGYVALDHPSTVSIHRGSLNQTNVEVHSTLVVDDDDDCPKQ